MTFRALALLLLLTPAFSRAADTTTVPPDLQAELIKMEDGTLINAQNSPQEVVARLKEWGAPNYTFIADNIGLNLAESIEMCLKRPRNISASIHDRHFVRQGDTILVYGFIDHAQPAGDKIIEMTNSPFMDVFIQVDGKWRCLASHVCIKGATITEKKK